MKDFVICIRGEAWETRSGKPTPPGPHPVKGGIYEVEGIEPVGSKNFYHLRGFDLGIYEASNFRPADNTFGEVVAEIIEKQLQLEPA